MDENVVEVYRHDLPEGTAPSSCFELQHNFDFYVSNPTNSNLLTFKM